MQGTLKEILQTTLDVEITIELTEEKISFRNDYKGCLTMFKDGRSFKFIRNNTQTIEQFTDLKLDKTYKFIIKGV